ncbi:hypothetical protein ACGFYE_23730 [Streptomyces zaomyceticus]|uniref:hypothetical protein n=1 Tax=Streptomyces zaomyceticus TaxID=68286 RepID=UPI00371D3979
MNAAVTPATQALDRAGLAGALVTLGCAIAFPVLGLLHPGTHLQPTDVPLSAEEFIRPLNAHADAVLLWMSIDTLFVIAYLTTFTAARALTVSRPLGTFGLAAMFAAGTLDMVENAVLAVAAAQVSGPDQLTAASTTVLYVIAQLKTAAATTGVAFLALALPTHTRLLRAVVGTAAAFVVVTVAGVALPELGPVEAAPILLLTALLAAVFTGRLRRAAANRAVPPAVVPHDLPV